MSPQDAHPADKFPLPDQIICPRWDRVLVRDGVSFDPTLLRMPGSGARGRGAGWPSVSRKRGQSRSPEPSMVRRRFGVLWVDDHRVMRQGLTGLLQAEPDIEIVSEASGGQTADVLTRHLFRHDSDRTACPVRRAISV